MITELAPRVRRGIAALETYEPGSTNRIDLERLNLYSLDSCALAQSIGGGSYRHGLSKLRIPANDDVTAEYGFSLRYSETDPDPEDSPGYRALRDAWIAELTTHRAAKAAD